MQKGDFLKDVVKKQKAGQAAGIISICTSNELVIEAVLEIGKRDNSAVLIESTCNQVNQFGGYTGMKPADFKNFLDGKAKEIGFPEEQLILGGDHLGPAPWQQEDAELAMGKAHQLIEDYVLAGYQKIHLDTSMCLGDDYLEPGEKMSMELIASRGALLALTAEKAYQKLKEQNPETKPPLYVIGSEVPVPGGASSADHGLKVSRANDVNETIRAYQKRFAKMQLGDAWSRVIALVVQPGVEFAAASVHDYRREDARELSNLIKKYPDLIFEAHSTDYQQDIALKQLVEDGFAILKVGPALTFALREGLFLLSQIEKELLQSSDFELSELIQTVDTVMKDDPVSWKKYYTGKESQLKLLRKYSFSDRIRYYWEVPEIKKAARLLIYNLKEVSIPITVISQYMPEQYQKIRKGELNNDPLSLLKDRIAITFRGYLQAVKDH